MLFLLCLSVLLSCKKQSSMPTKMTVQVTGDSTWTTTDVTTDNNQNQFLYITGYNNTSNKTITLNLSGYEPGGHSYAVSTNPTGTMPSSGQSQATYTSGANAYNASSGTVTVTNTTTKVLMGTFDFYCGNIHVTGSFSAPLP